MAASTAIKPAGRAAFELWGAFVVFVVLFSVGLSRGSSADELVSYPGAHACAGCHVPEFEA